MFSGRDLVAYNDPLLSPLLLAEREADATRELERLVSRAAPLIDRTLTAAAKNERQIDEDDADDLAGAITLRLLAKLHALRDSPQHAVLQFDEYVATLTTNALYDHLRRRFPERTRLRNRLRYTLSRDRRLALWETPAGTLCGVAAWRDQTFFVSHPSLTRDVATPAMLDADRPAEALLEVFQYLRRPMRLSALTELAAELWQIRDATPVPPVVTMRDPLPGALSALESRELLAAAWSELLRLPTRQRAALLLNLRSSHTANALTLIAITAVATFEEVAEAMDMSAADLAAIWNTLPLEDARIAELLGCTRQQVINLRKSARERLTRRLALHFQPRDDEAGHGSTRHGK